ncbi:MAG: hypothetical protein A2293_09130 [Elusimicrobia bacterium RIFOXYB2_FULL_49_7]|nr:MAG: hypothetical protein A2293_09130 [Elusimicrobia bacterium RIFOXYB2_FULL_49_7]
MELFEKAVNIDPNTAAVYTNLGIVYIGEKRHKESVVLFKKAIALDPDMMEARLNLSSAYTALGMSYEAQQEIKEVRLRTRSGAMVQGHNAGLKLQ